MFETFGVPGLYIAVQAVLALAASWSAKAVSNALPTFPSWEAGKRVTCALDHLSAGVKTAIGYHALMTPLHRCV